MLLEMSEEKARHMLELSRTLRWEFPTSQGTPIIRGQAASQDVEQATKERESYANAARVLLENGNEEGAIEIAANAWRLWIVARDLDGGRAFLASVADKGEKNPSRARSLTRYSDAGSVMTDGENERVAKNQYRRKAVKRAHQTTHKEQLESA